MRIVHEPDLVECAFAIGCVGVEGVGLLKQLGAFLDCCRVFQAECQERALCGWGVGVLLGDFLEVGFGFWPAFLMLGSSGEGAEGGGFDGFGTARSVEKFAVDAFGRFPLLPEGVEVGEHEAEFVFAAECPEFLGAGKQELHAAGDLEATVETVEGGFVFLLQCLVHIKGLGELRERFVVFAPVEGDETEVIAGIPFEACQVPGGGVAVDDHGRCGGCGV